MIGFSDGLNVVGEGHGNESKDSGEGHGKESKGSQNHIALYRLFLEHMCYYIRLEQFSGT